MVKALEPTHPVSRVSFESDGKSKKVPQGLNTLSNGVLAELYKRLAGDGLGESTIVERLTKEYGGALLENAKAIRSLIDAIDDSEFEKQKHRLDSIDVVSAEQKPRASPVPHPGTDQNPPREHPVIMTTPTATPIVVQGRHLPTPQYQEFPPAHVQPANPPGLVIPLDPSWGHGAPTTNVAPPTRVGPQAGMTCDPLFTATPSANLPHIPYGAPVGLNFASHQPPAVAPIPASLGQHGALGASNSALTSSAYHVDRLANPDTTTKPGTVEGLKRNEEILVYVARFFDNHTVALCPGVTGKPLALGLKALNEKLRPLYDQYRIPCGFSNRFCIFAAGLSWGGRDREEDHYLTEADSPHLVNTRLRQVYTPIGLDIGNQNPSLATC